VGVGLFKKEPLPATVVAGMDLIPGERVLAFGTDPLGRYVVATTHGLHLQRRPPAYSRIDWAAISHASFDVTGLRLDVVEDAGRVSLRVPLLDQGQVPEVVHDRVTSSIAVQQHVALRGRLGVTVAARRRPHEDRLEWTTTFDEELDPGDPALIALAEQALERVRDDSGLATG
jgi:hypothetical protein